MVLPRHRHLDKKCRFRHKIDTVPKTVGQSVSLGPRLAFLSKCWGHGIRPQIMCEYNFPFLATNDEIVECMCKEHKGKEMLNKIFNMSVQHAFNCIFLDSDFNLKYWKAVKFENVNSNEWTSSGNGNGEETRKLEYTIDLGAFGSPKNYEHQTISFKDLSKKVIIESQTSTIGVIYSDYFTVTTRFCLTKCSSNSCRILITNFIDYKKQPNFIVKSRCFCFLINYKHLNLELINIFFCFRYYRKKLFSFYERIFRSFRGKSYY